MSLSAPKEQDDRILVVTVCFNSLDTLRDWYRLRAEPRVRVVLVDNAHEPGLAEYANEIGAELVTSDDNVGFGRGCNLGLDRAEGEPWVVLVNPDASVDAAQLRELIRDVEDDVIARSPLLVDEQGEPHGDMFRRLPTVRSMVGMWLFGSRSRMARSNFSDVPLTAEALEVEVTSGSCLAVRREALESLGGFPDWIFLNHEDIYLLKGLGELGLIQVVPRIRVVHQKLSSARVVPFGAIRAETARAAASYTLMVHGVFGWLAVFFATVVGYSLRYLRNPPELARVPRLAEVEIREAWSLLRGRELLAGPVFVAERVPADDG